MVDTVNEFQQIFLSYKDVSEANPEWSDQMVEDYLATKRDISAATETADNAVDTSSAAVLIPSLIQRLDALENMRGPNFGHISQRIEALENVQQSKFGQIALDQISKNSLRVVVVTASYTSTGNEIIVCNNTVAIDITLNVAPEDRESVHVVRQNTGPVNVLGPALGGTSLTIGNRYSSPHFTYITELSSWVVI